MLEIGRPADLAARRGRHLSGPSERQVRCAVRYSEHVQPRYSLRLASKCGQDRGRPVSLFRFLIGVPKASPPRHVARTDQPLTLPPPAPRRPMIRNLLGCGVFGPLTEAVCIKLLTETTVLCVYGCAPQPPRQIRVLEYMRAEVRMPASTGRQCSSCLAVSRVMGAYFIQCNAEEFFCQSGPCTLFLAHQRWPRIAKRSVFMMSSCCSERSHCRVQPRLIHLYLSWTDAVSHDCPAHTQRSFHSLRRVSRSLMLHLGVELGSDQDDDDRKPDPDHEADTGP